MKVTLKSCDKTLERLARSRLAANHNQTTACNMCHGEGPPTAATTASAAMPAGRSYPPEAVKLLHLLQHAALQPEIMQAVLLQVSS